ncbi:hypothetical protein [Tenacibaculum piscium]|uniref:hypothetical protein n=1 Tax=Tenacibaculum piscium TaxID=1458515 RepID=UPI001F21A83D|nr:hypothetical protein [Tenacibaculum piscium]
MENQENWKNSTYFGILVNLILFSIVYVLTGFYLWKNINNIFIFLILYILTIIVLKFIITKIYSILTYETKLTKIENELYGINNRVNWGGIFTELVDPEKKYLGDTCKSTLKSLKDRPKTPQILKDIDELEEKLKEISDVVTGGSVFELFFCLRRLL